MADDDQSKHPILNKATTSPDELFRAKLLPLSRNSIYRACESGEIQCFRIGKRIVIPVAPLKLKLGIAA